MKEILKKITPESISYYIERNLDDFYIKSSEHPNFTSSEIEKVSWVFAKNADWPDCIFRANFKSLNIKSEINNIGNLIKNGRAPNGWTVGPLTRPKDLGIKLEKYGFSNVYHQAGMAVDLKDLEKKQITQNNLIIQRVESEESLIYWANIVSEVFNLKVDFAHLKFINAQKEAHFYIGIFKEEPISTLLLYLSSGVAGLHAVSTLPKYRNRGFGFAISRSALIEAFKRDYYVGVLQASSLGEKIYRKLGFEKYCDIISYTLLEDTKS